MNAAICATGILQWVRILIYKIKTMSTIFSSAAFELLLSVLIGIMTVFLTKMVVMNFYVKKTGEIDPYKNLSFLIFLSGTIFSVSYITFGIMEPLTATFKLIQTSNYSLGTLILKYAQYIGMFLFLGYVFSAAIVFIAYKMFAFLTTQLDEYTQIKENNVGVAILISVLTIVTAMFTKNPFIIFIESFIPYPDVPNIM